MTDESPIVTNCSSLYIDYLLDYNTGEEKSSKNLLGSATSEYDLLEKVIPVLKTRCAN